MKKLLLVLLLVAGCDGSDRTAFGSGPAGPEGPEGAEGQPGEQGPAGQDGLSGLNKDQLYEVTNPEVVQAGTEFQATVLCASLGDVVIAGGCSIGPVGNSIVKGGTMWDANTPIMATNDMERSGWRCAGTVDGEVTVLPTVVCRISVMP